MNFETREKEPTTGEIIRVKTEELIELIREKHGLPLTPERQTQPSEIAEKLYKELKGMSSRSRRGPSMFRIGRKLEHP